MFQKLKEEAGIVFLKLYTREILINLIEKEKSKQRVDSEKLKMKLFKSEEIPNQNSIEEISKNIDQKRITMIHREAIPISQPTYPIIESKKEEKIEQKEERKILTKEINEEGMERSMIHKPLLEEGEEEETKKEMKTNPQRVDLKRLLAKPVPMKMQAGGMIGDPMEKINPLLRDNTVVSIECPGPGKNIMIRKYNQVNMTRIVLSEPEINSIIDHFSKEARIPLAGGILKAAVGNSVISAVVSEFVGSRFVINKITPYSLIGPK